MSNEPIVNRSGEITIADPPIAHALFSTTRFAWLWLIIRLYLGWTWLSSGWGKISGGAWMTGEPLKGFWSGAVAIPAEGRPAIAFDWYRSFLQFMLDNGWYSWFGPLIAIGETAIGVALIAGALTGIAAAAGAFMNWNFIMAGSASTNGLLLMLAVFLVLAWKVAGWWGLDRWLLPLLGTPWHRAGDGGEGVRR